MSSIKPTFTDVKRRDIKCRIIAKDNVPALSVDLLNEDGSFDNLMLLNKYDAKQLSAACDLFLQQIFSAQFTAMQTSLSPEEMLTVFSNLDDDSE